MTGQNISIKIFWLTILIQKFEILFLKDFLFNPSVWFLFLCLLLLFICWVGGGDASGGNHSWLSQWREKPRNSSWGTAWKWTTNIFLVSVVQHFLKAWFDGLQETGGTTEDIWRPASFPWGFAQVTSLPYWTLLVNISQLNHLEGTTRCFALGILSGRITFQLELKNIPNLSWNQLNSLQLHCFQPHLSKTPLFCHLYPVQWKCKSFLEV